MTDIIFNLIYEKFKYNEKLIPIHSAEDRAKLKVFTQADIEEVFDHNYTLFKMALAEEDIKISYNLIYLLQRVVLEVGGGGGWYPIEGLRVGKTVPIKLSHLNSDYMGICFINDYGIPLEHFPHGIPLFLEMLKDYFYGPYDRLIHHPGYTKAAQAMRDDFEKCKDDPVLRKKMMDVDGYISIP